MRTFLRDLAAVVLVSVVVGLASAAAIVLTTDLARKVCWCK